MVSPEDVDALHGRTLAVLGQPVLDRYVFGVTHRISREAPVLIVREESRRDVLGGAANTAANLAGLGVRTWLVGPVGEDDDADRLLEACRRAEVQTEGLVRRAASVTVTKTRVLAGGVHTTRQQMLRVDREDEHPPPLAARRQLQTRARALLGEISGLIVSDYGHQDLIEMWLEVAREAPSGCPVVVDSRHGLMKCHGVTAVTPNEPEAELALGRRFPTEADAKDAARELQSRLDLEAALLTRGKEGMILAPRDGEAVVIPAIGGDAVDVTGAGDTVAATFAAALASSHDLVLAAHLANAAASLVVQRTGTTPIAADELRAHLAEASG